MSRMKWFGRSLLHLILLLLAVSLVSFLLVSMSPVDPLQNECRADGARLDGAGADREAAGVLGRWCAGLEALL